MAGTSPPSMGRLLRRFLAAQLPPASRCRSPDPRLTSNSADGEVCVRVTYHPCPAVLVMMILTTRQRRQGVVFGACLWVLQPGNTHGQVQPQNGGDQATRVDAIFRDRDRPDTPGCAVG